ncbi:hypothetical protein TMatcc_003070 [Talaromyces marneffei ATCC 18224]|uniref:DUF4604 domain-containing protein n=2 Tax=Talaromyces marneffei TaxID=37727 RepID=B6Q6B1_TALMQ|nr:uncharacterized protein EYB26_001866 [Talaromyces marneffei]EEA28586.1 conserved hypothetical protein [Talaromyces marneffei ATCC 18224]KAE8555792.1 hypothetical protein EYB25_000490 [Talaromyces marneffei]QGA14213.1 hypothetical protein EYB26_001866 [Talaromyces marneffei]
MAFNAKNLSYDRSEPAFLRKLRDQYGGADNVRHERPVPRPRKPKDNDDDDAPVYVDEETNETISKEDYEQLVNGTEGKDESTDQDEKGLEESTDAADSKATEQAAGDETKTQQNLAEIGTQKKRRKAKVIQEDDVAEDGSRSKDSSATSKSSAKPNAKRKKIKLSFDEPE